MGILEGARPVDETELKQLDMAGPDWVELTVQEFLRDYPDTPGVEQPASAFGTTRRGNARTAVNVVRSLNKYAEKNGLDVLASNKGEMVTLRHYTRPIQLQA
jgi:hypothetical protein